MQGWQGENPVADHVLPRVHRTLHFMSLVLVHAASTPMSQELLDEHGWHPPAAFSSPLRDQVEPSTHWGAGVQTVFRFAVQFA